MEDVYNDEQYEWTYEVDDHVAIWYLKGWQGYPDEALDAVSECYREVAIHNDINATICVFGDETNLPKETQEYMSEVWSQNGRHVDCERIGFVSTGITGMAVKANLEIPDVNLNYFNDLDVAVEWAKEAPLPDDD